MPTDMLRRFCSSPLPTVGCRGCTTCFDTTPPTCGTPSSDPKSCGSCARDKIVCPAGTGQIATCTSGTCGRQCDTANGYSGPVDDCRESQRSSVRDCRRALNVYSMTNYFDDTRRFYSGLPYHLSTYFRLRLDLQHL
jgi:hypothetical protein